VEEKESIIKILSGLLFLFTIVYIYLIAFSAEKFKM